MRKIFNGSKGKRQKNRPPCLHAVPSLIFRSEAKQMTDLTDMLIAARKRKCYGTLEMFMVEFITSLSRLGWCKINGDVDCGERWIWVSGAGMFHTEVAVCFALEEYVEVFKKAFAVTIIPVPDFDERLWSIDPERLNREVPEMEWAAVPEAVNPNCFSIKDLYFATV